MTKVGLYAIGKSTTLESNKSHREVREHVRTLVVVSRLICDFNQAA